MIKTKTGLFLALSILATILLSALINTWRTNFDWHDQHRLFQLIILISIASLLLLRPQPLLPPKIAWWLLITIFLFGLLSSNTADHPAWALKEWGRYAGLALTSLVIAKAAHTAWFFRSILYLLCGVAFLNAFQFLVFYLMAVATGIFMFNADLLFTGFSNPRFLNQFQVLFMPILAWASLHHWQSRHRYAKLFAGILFITLLVHWCIAFSLGSRGLWLGLAAAHAALLLFFPRFWKQLAVQAIAGMLGFVLYQVFFFIIPEWLGQEAWLRSSLRFGLSKREVIWQLAWDMFKANPWLGVGPMHFAASVNSIAAHPHQVVLQWLAEWGIFATISACILAIWGMLHGIRFLRGSKAKPVDAALWMSISGALAVAQVDGVFVMPYTETWLAILIGLALARWSAPPSLPVTTAMQPDRATILQGYSYKLLAVAVILILGNVLINEVPTLPQDSAAHMEKHGTGYTPRFWLQGWIPMESSEN